MQQMSGEAGALLRHLVLQAGFLTAEVDSCLADQFKISTPFLHHRPEL